mmetsp:Transcript_660/g.972  ORF Transcript_660/g.972 Transcript_660/m.972 type:complete len:91 (+) Transcript_660:9-281(+)
MNELEAKDLIIPNVSHRARPYFISRHAAKVDTTRCPQRSPELRSHPPLPHSARMEYVKSKRLAASGALLLYYALAIPVRGNAFHCKDRHF